MKIMHENMMIGNSKQETVILIPGIGLGGIEFLLFAARLRREGFTVRTFWKTPWRRPLADTARYLQAKLRKVEAEEGVERPHLVGHSLGGLLALQLLRDYPQQQLGRIVMLGAPLTNCIGAQRTLRVPGGRLLLGPALVAHCLHPDLPSPDGIEVGSIAGSLHLVLGHLLCPGKTNDTLVCEEETWHPDLTAHCVLPVSHISMVNSPEVSRQVAIFLRKGVFDVEAKE